MKKNCLCVIVMGFILTASFFSMAAEKSVPNVISFQSVLYDDGGNPIADGPVSTTFRIVDAAGALIYEEKQTLESVRGNVSALVGNGLNSSGAPTGGIPFEIFNLVDPRYLEVEVAGQPASSKMEISSVPYSMYSNYALKVIDLKYEDLSKEFIDKLGEALGTSKEPTGLVTREEVTTIYKDSDASSSIGVKPGFIYSGATSLQGVLNDLDAAIKRRDEKIAEAAKANTTALNSEAKARTDADTALSGSISGEATTRANADAALSGAISSEATARANADTALSSAISSEAAARASEDQILDAKINLSNQNIATNTAVMQSALPKAWVTIDFAKEGKAEFIGYGISEVVHNGENCELTVTFSTPFAGDYAVICTMGAKSVSHDDLMCQYDNKQSSSVELYNRDSDADCTGTGTMSAVFFGQ